MITNGPVKACQQSIRWEIIWFLKCPIPSSKSTSKDKLTQSFHEEDTPKYAKQIDQLQYFGQC